MTLVYLDAAVLRSVRGRLSRISGPRLRAMVWPFNPSCAFIALAALGAGAAGYRCGLWYSRWIRRISTCADGARYGRGRVRPTCPGRMTITDITPTRRIAGRNFRRVGTHSSATSRNHPRILPVCARLQRHRGSRLAPEDENSPPAAHGRPLLGKACRRGRSLRLCLDKRGALRHPRLADGLPHGRHQKRYRDWDDLIHYCTSRAGRPLRTRCAW